MFYKYDENRCFIGKVEGQVNPVNTKEILQPANSTTIKPPETKFNEVAVFMFDRWIVEDKNKQSFQNITPEKVENKIDELKSQRDILLLDTDKYMLEDHPIDVDTKNNYKKYRQYLRDITKDKNFPNIKLKTFNEFIVAIKEVKNV